MKKFLSLLDKNKRFFLLTLLVGIVYTAISVAIPTISGRLITSVVADSANRTKLLCIFLLISLFQLCFAELDEYMGNTAQNKAEEPDAAGMRFMPSPRRTAPNARISPPLCRL